MARLTLLVSGVVSLLAIGIVACTQAPEVMPDTVPQAWVEALNARRPQDLASLYTEDCVVLPPDDPTVKGRQAVMDFYIPLMKYGITIEVANEESETRGDLTFRRGTYALKNKDAEVTERGKYLQIWRKQKEGAWLLSRDIWNTDEKRQVVPPAMIQ